MTCNHPLGFTALRGETLTCFDCGTHCPGKCTCGANFRSMVCGNHKHLRGPQLVEASA